MNYIITKGRYYVAREYLGQYMARDYLLPLLSEYGGRVTASNALVFDREADAQAYLARNMLDNDYTVTKYNIRCNCVSAE